jgi:hypothetical protein
MFIFKASLILPFNFLITYNTTNPGDVDRSIRTILQCTASGSVLCLCLLLDPLSSVYLVGETTY